MAEWALDDRAQLHKDANAALDENLASGERVEVIIRGNLSSAIIGTDRRLFVFKKGWLSGSAFGKKMATWDYRNITGVQIETGILSGTVAVQAAGITMGDYSYWSTGKDDPQKAANALAIARDHFPQARSGVARLRELLSAAQHAPVANSTQAPPDLADQLRKLASLRDEGILTEEEFQAKKAQLLA
jgi:hypothetical protein